PSESVRPVQNAGSIMRALPPEQTPSGSRVVQFTARAGQAVKGSESLRRKEVRVVFAPAVGVARSTYSAFHCTAAWPGGRQSSRAILPRAVPCRGVSCLDSPRARGSQPAAEPTEQAQGHGRGAEGNEGQQRKDRPAAHRVRAETGGAHEGQK